MKTLRILITLSFISTLIVGCSNSDDYGVEYSECVDLTVTKQVQDITSQATATYKKYDAADIIEAYVTSSDEGGNFYKTISFMSLDGTTGFSMPIDNYNLFNSYEPGRKVFINMKDRYFVTEFNSTVIGSLYNNNTPDVLTDDEVGRISGVEYKNVITRSCDKVNEDEIVKHLTIAQAKNNQYLNMLIEFDNVQFADASNGKKFFDTTLNNLGGATNHTLTDTQGNTIIFRVSEFANFATRLVPTGNGKIRGVLTKFNNDFQFMPRTINDVNLTGDRSEIDFFPPIVGNNISFSGNFTENFESYAVTNPFLTAFPMYVNDAAPGSRYWQLKQFSGNKYIEMTSFAGTGLAGVPGKTYFFVPVDFTVANTFTFSKEFRFMAGEALKVYYVTSANYTAGGAINLANFIDITSSFTSLTYPTAGQSQSTFTTAGTYNIPSSLTGTGFFVYEYTGTTTVTTTVQIDNITVN